MAELQFHLPNYCWLHSYRCYHRFLFLKISSMATSWLLVLKCFSPKRYGIDQQRSLVKLNHVLGNGFLCYVQSILAILVRKKSSNHFDNWIISRDDLYESKEKPFGIFRQSVLPITDCSVQLLPYYNLYINCTYTYSRFSYFRGK